MSGFPVPELPVARVVVWRHGRTEWNASGRFQGQLDPSLDTRGSEQAALAAPHLAAELSAEDTVVVSSDLRRARETAGTLTALLGVPLRLDPRLREHQLGLWEGLTRAQVAERYPDQHADWLAGRPVAGRGGEEAEHVVARAVAALADLPPVASAVVVTHGGTSARLIEALLELGPDHRRLFGPLGNCSWSELRHQGGRWRLMRHNVSAPGLADGSRPGGNGATGSTLDPGPVSDEATAAPGDAEAVL